jgi:hypothetical protein
MAPPLPLPPQTVAAMGARVPLQLYFWVRLHHHTSFRALWLTPARAMGESGRLYGLTAYEALELCKQYHDCRVDVKAKPGYNHLPPIVCIL